MSQVPDGLATVLHFERAQVEDVNPDIRNNCLALGFDVDYLKLAPIPVVEAAIDFAHQTLKSAIEEYYKDPEATTTPASQITERFLQHVKEVQPTVDGAIVDTAIRTVTWDESTTTMHEKQAEAIASLYMSGAQLAITEAMHALKGSNPKRLEKARTIFAAQGIMFDGPLTPNNAEQQVVQQIQESSNRGRMAAVGIVSAALLIGTAGQAAAAEKPSPNGNNQTAVVVEANPDGSIVDKSPTSPQDSQATTNQSSEQAPTPADPVTDPSSVPSVGSTPDTQSSTNPKTVKPEQTTPDTIQKVPLPYIQTNPPSNTIDKVPLPYNSSEPPKEVPLPYILTTPTIPEQPTSPVTPESPAPETAPLVLGEPDQAATAAQNTAEAQTVVPTLSTNLDAALGRIQKAIQTGSLNQLAVGPNDVFASPDPAHPKNVLKMPMTRDQKAQLEAQDSLMQGVLANDPEVMQVVSDYFAAHPLSGTLGEAISKAVDVPLAKPHEADLNAQQKINLLMMMNAMSSPLIASATGVVHNADQAYAAAQLAAYNRAHQVVAQPETVTTSTDRYSLLVPKINDKQKVIDGINAYILKVSPDSPMVGMGEYLYDGFTKWGLSPAVGTVSAQMESQLCSDKGSVCVTHQTFNPWNRECPTDKPNIAYTDGTSGYHHHACAYLSFKDALLRDDFTGPQAAGQGYDSFPQYVHRKYILKGKTTVEAMLTSFTPISEDGKKAHAALIKGYQHELDKLYALIGDGISFTSTKTSSHSTKVKSQSESRTPSTSASSGSSKVSFTMAHGLPYQAQVDPKWNWMSYNWPGAVNRHYTIGSSACLPSTEANIATVFGKPLSIVDSARWNQNNGFRVPDHGTADESWYAFAKKYNLEIGRVALNSQAFKDILAENTDPSHPVVQIAVSGQDYNPNTPATSAGHWFDVTNVDSNDKFQILDSFKPGNSNRDFTFSQLDDNGPRVAFVLRTKSLPSNPAVARHYQRRG